MPSTVRSEPIWINNSDLIPFWKGLRQSVYGSFTDHPRYNWQFRPGTVVKGTIQSNEHFCKAVESLVPLVPKMKESPLFLLDLTEMTAQYVGGRLEILVQAIDRAHSHNDKNKAEALERQFVDLALEMDALLNTHSTLRMDNWIDLAVKNGDSPALKKFHEKNARRLVTIWGPPVDDYSARIWSGLIRDYYVPRWQHYFKSKKTNQPFDFAKWERDWVENRTRLTRQRR